MIRKITMIALAAAALGLIGYGSFLAYRPAGFIVPGLLIWIDITQMSKGGKNVNSERRSG